MVKYFAIIFSIVFLSGMNGLNAAQQMPEFPGTVKFIDGQVPVKLSNLKGKMVIIIYYQSWCPLCSKWSPTLFKQVEEKFKNDPSVVLIALKTDGGVKTVDPYIKGKISDKSQWVLAADSTGGAMKMMGFKSTLYNYAIINPKGDIARAGQAGMFYVSGGKKIFSLSLDKITKDIRVGAKRFLAKETYSDELAGAVKLAELGETEKALKELLKIEKKVKDKESFAALNKELKDIVKKRVVQALKDSESEDLIVRFLSMQKLVALQVFYNRSKTDLGKSIYDKIKVLKKDKSLKKELAAEKSYLSYSKWLAKQKNLPITKNKKYLQSYSKKHKGTYYGKIFSDLLGSGK